ncbi:Shedu immune nuclease family protein [Frigidibacter oleivorans]|uniref:Shedu immune nuclease family protein n=1 Tax=Frigidibacter oleivorans TaxID=2487129 RepID=UPI000F8C7567|nr:Shedu immune nuclease family protein [Frigidibacter oleivorans]
MTDDEAKFFQLRKSGKTFISKVFSWKENSEERLRHVRIVMDGSDIIHLGEIEGAVCLRLSGEKRKTQVAAVVSQDDKAIRRLTLQTFQSRQQGDWYQGYEEHAFTFRRDEFERLLAFLERIKFVDLSNQERFEIEDISTGTGRKAIIDAADGDIVKRFLSMGAQDREAALRALGNSLSPRDIDILLGRQAALKVFEQQLLAGSWIERDWQQFFESQPWVFGYGLDYRVMRTFDREVTVGAGGTDNRNKPAVDFLTSFSDYTVLVEIKRPDARIFQVRKGGRAGTWSFSADFTDAVSQILEQKAEWLSFASTGEHHSKDGKRRLEARTRDPKAILVVGSKKEFDATDDLRARQVMRDTFELFRRDSRSVEIITFDELLERAQFITRER